MSEEELRAGRVFPSVASIRDVSREVAIAVAEHAYDKNIARKSPARHETVADMIDRRMYFPDYVPIISNQFD